MITLFMRVGTYPTRNFATLGDRVRIAAEIGLALETVRDKTGSTDVERTWRERRLPALGG